MSELDIQCLPADLPEFVEVDLSSLQIGHSMHLADIKLPKGVESTQLRTGDNARGSAKVEWSIPISGYLKAHLSLFSGYGESLIDYNFRETRLGLGISVVEWK